MKKTFTILALLITIFSFSQESEKAPGNGKTKMETFASKTGVITKFTDYNLNSIKTPYSFAKTRIRMMDVGGVEVYFYQIEKSLKYGTAIASIEYSDLLEVIKAFNNLKTNVEKDISSDPDYLQNAFITEDGFKVGYYVKKGKATWYLRLENYGSDKTITIKDSELINSSFIEAKNKIEELKK